MLHMNNSALSARIWNHLKSMSTAKSESMAQYMNGMLAGMLIERQVPYEERERICKFSDNVAYRRAEELRND